MKTINIFATGQYPEGLTVIESLDRLVTGYFENILKKGGHIRLTTGISTNFELLCAMSAMRLGTADVTIDTDILLTEEEYDCFFVSIGDEPTAPHEAGEFPDETMAIMEAAHLRYITDRVQSYVEAVRQSDILLYFPDLLSRDPVFRALIEETKANPSIQTVDILKT